jgi:hypothetical protein
VALLGVAVAFVIYPLVESKDDVISSDWPAFATGARLILEDPGHLYDLDKQKQIEFEVTGGKTLISLSIKGILPFLAPAWVAPIALPFELLGTNLGGRLWILFGLACFALGVYLATRPRPPSAALPAFASVPTALVLLNAQLDGLVALGIGAAIALWSRPYLAGLALGLTLMKPHLVLALGAALLVARKWRVLAGWATAGVALWASVAVLNPRWVLDWLAPSGKTIQTGAREVNLAHFAVYFGPLQNVGVAVLTVVAIVVVVLLAWRRRDDFRTAAAIVVAGGIVAAPHALATDLAIVSLALAIWGRAQWHDWLLLSAAALVAALVPAPWPAIIGVVLIGWLLYRIGRRPDRARIPAARPFDKCKVEP